MSAMYTLTKSLAARVWLPVCATLLLSFSATTTAATDDTSADTEAAQSSGGSGNSDVSCGDDAADLEHIQRQLDGALSSVMPMINVVAALGAALRRW